MLRESEPRLVSPAASCAAAASWQCTGAQRKGNFLSNLADNLRGRFPTKQTDLDLPVVPVPAATQTEETELSAVASSVDTGTAACLMADYMQTDEPMPSDVHLPSDQDASLSMVTNAEAPSPQRRRKRHKQKKKKAAAPRDDDDDALLNAAITSVALRRSTRPADALDQLADVLSRTLLAEKGTERCGFSDGSRSYCRLCTEPGIGAFSCYHPWSGGRRGSGSSPTCSGFDRSCGNRRRGIDCASSAQAPSVKAHYRGH